MNGIEIEMNGIKNIPMPAGNTGYGLLCSNVVVGQKKHKIRCEYVRQSVSLLFFKDGDMMSSGQ